MSTGRPADTMRRDIPFRPGFGHGRGGPPGMGMMMGGMGQARDVRGTMRRLWGYLKRQKWLLMGTVVLVALSSGLALLGPYLMGIAIDTYILKGDLPGLARTALLMIGAYGASSLATWLQLYVMANVAQRTVRDIRNDLFARLQTLSLRFFDRHPHGELMSRLSNDVENISNVLNMGVTQFISSVLSIAGVVVVMCLINWRLALVSLVTVPLMVFLNSAVAMQTRQGFREQQKTLGELNGIIEETITGQRVVKAFVREQAAMATFEVANRKLQRVATRAEIFAGFVGPMMNLVNNLGFAIIAGAGGWMALRGLATVGNIASFINYAREFGRPLNEIAQLYAHIQGAIAGAERVFEVLDEMPEPVSYTHLTLPTIYSV